MGRDAAWNSSKQRFLRFLSGQMTVKTLSDHVEIIMGQSPRGSRVSRSIGLPLLNGPTEFGSYHPTPVQFTKEARKVAKSGDLLFCVRGSTTGRMNWADQEYAIGRGLAAIRHRLTSELQPLVRAVIEVELPELLAQATGSTFPNVSASQLSEIPYPNISVAEQRSIAQILGRLDDKIELNRRMNEALEEIARALFKSWFVDFHPVRAKIEGRDTGLPKYIADLFPARMVDSESGEIPEGWEVAPLDKIADFLNGLALQKFPPTDQAESLPVIKIAELRNGISLKTNYASHDIPEKYIIKNGDFLFSWSGSLLAKFWTAGEGALNQHLFKVTSECYPMWFVSQWVYRHLDNFRAIAASKVTTMGHIQRGHLKEALVTCPPRKTLEYIGSIQQPILEMSICNELESQTLTNIRDTLLPKLISGAIRVNGTQHEIEVVE